MNSLYLHVSIYKLLSGGQIIGSGIMKSTSPSSQLLKFSLFPGPWIPCRHSLIGWGFLTCMETNFSKLWSTPKGALDVTVVKIWPNCSFQETIASHWVVRETVCFIKEMAAGGASFFRGLALHLSCSKPSLFSSEGYYEPLPSSSLRKAHQRRWCAASCNRHLQFVKGHHFNFLECPQTRL